jgi:tetratricopeptide (TPR) repeat protein
VNEEGKAALARGDFETARTRFQAAAKADPHNLQIQFNLGLAAIRLGQPRQAIAPLRKAAADPSLAAEAHYLLGAAYFESGEFPEVAANLAGLENSAHAEHVLFLLEESYRLTHRAAEARQAFHLLNSRFPDSPWVHYLLANAYENQAENEKAIAEYKVALVHAPKLPNANFAIGYLYFQDKDFEQAKTWLRQELAVQSCHTLAYYYLAEIARTGGDANDAGRQYRRALACDDRNAKAHTGLGILLTGLHRNEEAMRELRHAIQLDPGDATPHYRLAVLYRELGRKAEADAEYARVKQINAAGQQQAAESLKGK